MTGLELLKQEMINRGCNTDLKVIVKMMVGETE